MTIRNLLVSLLLFALSPFPLWSQSNYTLINDAIQISGCHCYQLTADVGDQGGGVYQNNSINLTNSFDYTFSIFLGSNNNGADGMCFILTNNITQIGAQGGGLGYSGLAGNSLAVEYDTYQNSWDPNNHHMALEYAGQVEHPTGTLVGPVDGIPSGAAMDDNNWHTTEVVWNAATQTYTVYFDGVLRLSYTGNIVANFFANNPVVNWGWSGSTGGDENTQQVCFNSTANFTAGTNYQSCDPTLQFSDVSTSAVATIQGWSWNFGDPGSGAANTSTLQNPTHTFSTTGTFTVTEIVTDISGCQDTSTHQIIIAPNITLTPAITDPPCNGGTNGSIDVTATGGFGASAGLGGYHYTWSNGLSGYTGANDDLGLTAGTYDITVNDGVCSVTATYTLTEPSAITATTSTTDASCGTDNGSVTITISGGNPPYQNVVWDGVPATASGNSYTRTGLGAGTYVANFTDANGCSALLEYTATVVSLPCGYTVSASSTNVSCFGGSNGSVTLSVTGTVGTATITWTNAGGTTVGTGATVTGLPAGTYTYHYTDQLPTTFTGTVVVTAPGGPLTVSLDTINTTCSYLDNGSAVASVTANGTPIYHYSWSVAGEPDGPTATGLSPGSIAVTVTDANGCTGTASGTVFGQTPLNLTVGTQADSCYHDSTGIIWVNVSGGNPDYTYLWNSSSTAIGDTTFGLATGAYTVTVTDHNGCTATATGSISQPPLLTATISDSNVACFGGATGTIAITTGGGNGGYTYTWSGGVSTTDSAQNLPANTYYVTITDSKLCTVIDTATITQPTTAFTVTEDSVNVACFGLATGSITLTLSGGSLPYGTVTWTGGATGTSRTGLSAGTYSYTVSDAHDCQVTGSITITQPASAFVVAVTDTDVRCFGGNDGSITLTPSGGTTPYATAEWLDLFIGDVRNNLVAGTYYWADSDAHGCIDTGRVVITQPALLVTDTASTHQVSCYGGNNGAITLTVAGGTYPYTYTWPQTPSITDSLDIGLTAGTYTTYVTDAHGCADTITEIISEPAPLVPSVTALDSVSCFSGNDGSIIVSTTGGTMPYTYALDGSGTYQSSDTFIGLSAGSHTVTVQDAHGCDSTISFTVYQPSVIIPSIAYTLDVSCHGSCNGSISASATGGTPPYAFSINGINFSAVDSFTSLCAGPYVITVKDALGCTQTISDTVTQPDSLLLSVVSTTEPLCFGGNDGSVTVSASGGTPAYLFSVDFGTPQLTGTFTGLSAGTHVLSILDSHFCIDTIHVLLGQPAQLIADTLSTLDISCFGGDNGAITLGVSGGIYPFSYSWPQSPGTSDSLGTNLSAGTDTIYVTDAHGCRDTLSVVLTQPHALSPYVVAIDSVSCFGGSNGGFTVSDSGGTAPYTYAIDGSATYQSSGTFTGLSAGTHTVTVKDAHLCDSTISINIYQPTLLVPSVLYTKESSCYNSCNGSIALSATGGTPPYTFSKDGVNYSAVDSFPSLCAGYDTLYVKDAKGCTESIIDSITQPDSLTLAITDTIDPTCFGSANGQVAVSAGGGTPVYSYSLDGGAAQSTDSFTSVNSSAHTVTVTDHNGCSTTISFAVGQPAPVITDTARVINDTCYGSSNGVIYLTSSGGFGPYTYTWQQIPGNTDSFATGLAAGSYTAVITDVHGCQETVTEVISQPAQPELTILPSDTTISYGDTIQLYSQFGPTSLGTPNAYLWSDTNSALSCLTCPMPTLISNDSISAYSLQVTYNNNLCTITATTTVTVSQQDTFAVADAFTPNGDGKNDTYYIQAKDVKSFHMDIYDRWGSIVFSTDDITQGWDGTYKGIAQPEGVYVVFFSLQYGKKFTQRTASITLLR